MKVLIISHNPTSTYNNMGRTFCALFKGFSPEELCQFYIYPSMPDAAVCGAYYQLTDTAVLKACLTRKAEGREVQAAAQQGIAAQSSPDPRLYGNSRNRRPFRRLIRDLVWKFAPWDHAGLRRWLEHEKPEWIFLAPGEARFIYDVAMKISERYHIPIITYICDDYYFMDEPEKPADRLCLRLLRRTMERLMKQTKHIVTICDSMNRQYSGYFGVPATTIMTSSGFEIAKAPRPIAAPKTLTYMGNLQCNRHIPLVEIGQALDEINREQNSDYRLKIYSGEQDAAILSAFEKIRSIDFCGFVTGAEFDTVFHQAEILLHVEAFDAASIALVRGSVSTKIADILGSGIPLFAYGPSEVASILHLMDHHCAVVADNSDLLKQKLQMLFGSAENCREITENALRTAQTYHNTQTNSLKMRELFQ